MVAAPPSGESRRSNPRRRARRRLVIALVALVALPVALVLAAWLRPDLTGTVLLRSLAMAGVRVRAEAMDLRLFPPVLEARGLELDAGPGLRLRVRQLRAVAGPWLGLGGGPLLALLEAHGLEADAALSGGQGGGSGNPLAWLDRMGRVVVDDSVLRLAGSDGAPLAGLTGIALALDASPGAGAHRDLELRAELDLEQGAGTLWFTGLVLPGGSVGGELALDGRLTGRSLSGELTLRALADWDVSDPAAPFLDVPALDVSLSGFHARPGPGPESGVRLSGGRAWVQAGLDWAPGRPPDLRRAHLALEGCLFRAGAGARAGEGSVQLSGALDLEAEVRSGGPGPGRSLDMESCRILLTDLEATLPGGPLRVPLATVTARGSLDPDSLAMSVDRAELRLGRDGRLLEAVAGLRGAPGGPWLAELAGRAPDPGRVLELVGPLLPRSLDGLRPAGELPVHAQWRSRAEADAPAGLVVGARPKGLRLHWPAHGLSATLEGRLDLFLPDQGEPELDGGLALTGTGRAGPLEARRAVARADVSGPLSGPALSGLLLDVPAGGLTWDGVALPLGKVALGGDLELADHRLAGRGLSLSAQGLGRVTGELDLPLSVPWSGRARLAAPSLDLLATARVLQAMGLVTADLPLAGGAADIEATLDKGEAALKAGLRGLSLATADQTVMAEGLDGAFSVQGGPAGDRPWRASVRLDHGQCLAGTVFLDFAAHPLSATLGARGDGQGGLTGASGGLEMGGLGAVDLFWGSLARADGHWSWAGHVGLREPRLTALMETLVRQPLAFSHPGLATLDVRLRPGGDLSMDLSLAASPGVLDMAGRLAMRGADVSWPAQGLNATGLDADLPFAYTFGAAPAPPDAPLPTPPVDEDRWGRLRCDALATPTGVLEGLDLGLALEPGGLFTRGEVAVPMLGGRVVLGALRASDPLSRAFRLQVPARLEDVDLSRVRPAGVSLQGSLSGDLGLVRADMDRLEAPGRLLGTFFGGPLEVSGLAVDRPLDQGRVVGIGRARVRGLDLERLSTALAVGRVTGRMDIGLDNAAVAWGQPQRMDLRIESVKTPDVRQLVSLKAVNTISVIGTGSGLTDMGVGVFASFFKEFAYEGIGIACTLRNDVFRVRGLIHGGGVEYLIKKPLFFGINVVNQNPDNRIGFSDMMERIGRAVGTPPGKRPASKENP